MKSFLLVLAVLLRVTLFSQTDFLSQKIDFNVTDEPVPKALDLLSEQTGIDIAYSKSFFRDSPPITLDKENVAFEQVLIEILSETGVRFKTLGENRVLLFKDEQKLFTLSGYVMDDETGEEVIGARIYNITDKTGTITNEYGFFSMEIQSLPVRLEVRSVGFKLYIDTLRSVPENAMDIRLKIIDDLPVVIVEGDSTREVPPEPLFQEDQDHILTISPRTLDGLPNTGGQNDLTNVFEVLPGTSSFADGFGGLNVRGGNPGQNLVLLDGAPLYIPYHLMGLYSAYNPETIRSVKFIKRNAPARYGGASSAIMDIRLREGDLYKWKGSANINLLNAGATLEGPLKKEKGSILLSARYSPFAYFLEPSIERIYFKKTAGNLNTVFYDAHGKVNYKITKKDRLYLSYFLSEDQLSQNVSNRPAINTREFTYSNLQWRNNVASLRWNHTFSKKRFMNTTVTYSNYEHLFSSQREFLTLEEGFNSYDLYVIDNRSTNTDVGVSMDFDHHLSNRHHLRYGFRHQMRWFSPGFYFLSETDFNVSDTSLNGEIYNFSEYYESNPYDDYQIQETAIYLEDQIKFKKWYFNIGARIGSFVTENAHHINPQPRLLGVYKVSKRVSTSLLYNRRVQYLHLISNPAIQLPNDLWLPSSEDILPQDMQEIDWGMSAELSPSLSVRSSLFWRQTKNVYSYPESLDFLYETIDYSTYDFLVKGMSLNRGVELSTAYINQRVHWMMSYTLSKSELVFDEINQGVPFASYFDARHQIDFTLQYQISPTFQVGVNGVLRSPRPQVNVVRFAGDGNFENVNQDPSGQINTTRSGLYSRIDISVRHEKQLENIKYQIKFGAFNALNSRNIAFHEVQSVDNATNEVITSPQYGLGITPSFSIKIDF